MSTGWTGGGTRVTLAPPLLSAMAEAADVIGQFFCLEDFLGVVKDLSFCAAGSACGPPFRCAVVGDPEQCALFRLLVQVIFGEYYGARVVVEDFETEEEARREVGPRARIPRCVRRSNALEVPPELFFRAAPAVVTLLLDTFRAIMQSYDYTSSYRAC